MPPIKSAFPSTQPAVSKPAVSARDSTVRPLSADERHLCEIEHYVLLTKRHGAGHWTASVYGGSNTGKIVRDQIADTAEARTLFAGFDLRIEEPR